MIRKIILMSKKKPETMTVTEVAKALTVTNAEVRRLAALGRLSYSGSRISKASVIALVRKDVIGR